MVAKATGATYKLPIAIHSAVKIIPLESHPGLVLGISITGPNIESDVWYTVRHFINGGAMSELFLAFELEVTNE